MPTLMLDRINVKIFILYLVVAICVIIYTAYTYWRISPKRAIDDAAHDSEYDQCEFVIYDKSTPDVCDRLIVVKPFDWTLWNTRKHLFVLNPEKYIDCGNGNSSTGAVRIMRDKFHETCLNVSADRLDLEYKRPDADTVVFVKKIPYTIDGQTFTVLSAINALLDRKLLDFDPDDKRTGTDVISSENLYAIHQLGQHMPSAKSSWNKLKKRETSDGADDYSKSSTIVEHNRNSAILSSEYKLVERINRDIERVRPVLMRRQNKSPERVLDCERADVSDASEYA